MQVDYLGQVSNSFPLTPSSSAPALFTFDGSGSGPAAALNQNLSSNTPNNPAAPGSYLILFMTGEGQTAPLGITGKLTTVSTTSPITPQPVLPVMVTIAGQEAPVTFYGEAPGIVSGVMQVNMQIPMSASPGNLPVVISVGANRTQPGVTVAVR